MRINWSHYREGLQGLQTLRRKIQNAPFGFARPVVFPEVTIQPHYLHFLRLLFHFPRTLFMFLFMVDVWPSAVQRTGSPSCPSRAKWLDWNAQIKPQIFVLCFTQTVHSIYFPIKSSFLLLDSINIFPFQLIGKCSDICGMVFTKLWHTPNNFNGKLWFITLNQRCIIK